MSLSKESSLLQRLTIPVTSMMEISKISELHIDYDVHSFPESGVRDTDGDGVTERLRVRANHSFVISLYKIDNTPIDNYTLELAKPVSDTTIPAVCSLVPLSGYQQQISIECCCSTDQVFLLKQSKQQENSIPLISTATAP